MGRKGRLKGRSYRTHQNKKKRLEKLYNKSKKLQAKYTLEEWIGKIKEPNIHKGGL